MALLSLIAKLGLDKTGFEAGLNSAGKKVASFGAGLKSQLAGAFGAAAVVAFTKSALDYAATIGDMAERLGVSTDAAQQFGLAAKMSGQDIEFVGTAFDKFRKKRDEALRTGNVGAFASLGLSIRDLQSLDAVDFFQKLAIGIEQNGVKGREATFVFEMFEKSAGKVIGMLQDFEKAKGSAALISPDDIKSAQAFDDGWQSAIQNAKAGFVNFIASLKRGDAREIGKGFLQWQTFGLFGGGETQEEIEQRQASDKERDDALKLGAQKEKERLEQEQIAALTSRIEAAAEKNRQAGLTTEEKILEAKEKQAQIEQKIADINAADKFDKAAQLEAIEALINQRGIVEALERSVKPAKTQDADTFKPFSPSTDSLGRIGGRIGSGASVSSKLDKQIRHLEKIEMRLRDGIKIQDL